MGDGMKFKGRNVFRLQLLTYQSIFGRQKVISLLSKSSIYTTVPYIDLLAYVEEISLNVTVSFTNKSLDWHFWCRIYLL